VCAPQLSQENEVETVAELPEVAERWIDYVRAQNRSGARVLLYIVLVLYPAFGILDYIISRITPDFPKQTLYTLWASRIVVTACTLGMFPIVRSRFFDRHPSTVTSAYILLCACGIDVMIVLMGGMESGYYAGLSLAMVAIGLLFLWPTRVVLFTHSSIVVSFVLPNLFLNPISKPIDAVSNFFFLLATGIIASTGQVFAWRNQRKELANTILLERTKANLEEAHTKLKQLDEFKSTFFANITHELKTPLAMILSPLELMIDGELGKVTDSQKATLQTMLRSGMKLLKLINDLLDLTKLEESRIRLRASEQDLTEYLRGLAEQVKPLTLRKGIELTFIAPETPFRLYCDLERLERVFINLLSNAAKFTPQQGHIRVTLRGVADGVEVEVKDDGPGFPQDKAEQVFERFFQVDQSGTRRYGGTGIGLALAKELVELHGGRIWAQSEEGAGATFTVFLRSGKAHLKPDQIVAAEETFQRRESTGRDSGLMDTSVEMSTRKDYRLLDIAEASERRVVERDWDENDRQWTVLIVEDNPDVIRVIHLSLRREFKVMAAPDGLKGFELALKEQPNLIITDLMMPGIDGLELTKRLRAEPLTKYTPIIMLTARGGTEDRIAGIEQGVNAYLSKPFSAKELLSTARSLLNVQESQADLLMTQRMDSLETIAGGLAHEINNPLNYIKNSVARIKLDFADTLLMVNDAKQEPLKDAQAVKIDKIAVRFQKMIDTAESGVKRIAGTVELMGRYSREGYSRDLREHDVFQAARDVVQIVLPATGREVRVIETMPEDGLVHCVPEELNQVLSNLLQNAFEAVAEGTGEVHLFGSTTDEHVELHVKDNGAGMPDAVKQKIFNPFFSTKGPGKGMGMGLTMTRRVVQSLGGTIAVHSELGKGTEFVVRIPRNRAALVA
jgi:signal transduction histidine kinase